MVFKNKSTRLIPNIPRWLIPIVAIIATALFFFIGQYAASLILSIYALARGWSVAYANSWLSQSITAQFFYVLLAESFTVGQIFLFLKYYGKSLADIGLTKRFKPIWLLYALIAYPAYLLLYLVLLAIATHLFPNLNVNEVQQIGFTSVHGTYQLVLTFFSLVILPPIAEEVLFRGFLFDSLKKAMPVMYAGILTSLLFASAHLPEGGAAGPLWIGAIDTFTLSLVLVFLKQKTKSLWPGICLHALKNLVAFISLFILTAR